MAADARPTGRRTLVTGGAGFIGSALCRRLAAMGDDVTALVRPGGRRDRLVGIAGDLTVIEADLGVRADTAAIIDRVAPEIVFHLASSAFNPPGQTAFDHLDGNAGATLSLLEAVKDRPETRFVFTSSIAEYPPGTKSAAGAAPGPVNLYGAMKACASLLVDTYGRMYGLRTARAILFMVYGPGEASHRLVPSAIRSALRGSTVHVRDGSVERDMLYIDDAVDGLCLLGDAETASGTVVELCSGVGTAVRCVADEVVRLTGAPVSVEEDAGRARPDEIRFMAGDNRRAHDLLGWRPRHSLEQGLVKSIAWHRMKRDETRETE